MFGVIKLLEIKETLLKTELYYILISCFLINVCSLQLYAQFLPHNPNRFELIIPNNDPGYDVIPAKEYGLVMHRLVSNDNSQHLEIQCTDTAMTTTWKGYLPIKKSFKISRYAVADGSLFLIFYRTDFSDRSFQLFQVDLKTGDYLSYEVRNSIPFVPTFFQVTKQGAIIGGYFVRVPVVLFFSFSTLRGNILPGLFNEAGELTQIRVNSDDTFSLLIASKNFRNQKTIWVKNYSPNGSLKTNLAINPEEGFQLISGSIVETDENLKIIVGPFSTRNLDYSQGIFITKIYKSGDQATEYFKYSDLNNFFKYLPLKRQERVKKKIDRKKKQGKKIKLQYRFLFHDLISLRDQYVFVGEAFFAKYRQNERAGGFGTGSTYSTLVFDGYQYTHAMVLGISKEGKLKWDNSFDMKELKTLSLEYFLRTSMGTKEPIFVYRYNNKVNVKLVNETSVIEGKKYNEREQRFENDNLSYKGSKINDMDFWYKNYFISYGLQEKIMESELGKTRVKIFFIDKLNYR